MISDLLQASSDGDLNIVNQILAHPSSLDIEQKGPSPPPFLPHITDSPDSSSHHTRFSFLSTHHS